MTPEQRAASDAAHPLVPFLRARWVEEETLIRRAQHPTAAAEGEHWRWMYDRSDYDTPVDLDTADEYLCDRVSLRSEEHYETQFVGKLPHFLVFSDETTRGFARFSARFDARRMLAEIRAKRSILDAHPLETNPTHLVGGRIGTPSPGYGCKVCHNFDGQEMSVQLTMDEGLCDTLRALGWPHSGHPDYQQEWT